MRRLVDSWSVDEATCLVAKFGTIADRIDVQGKPR
jgi:hypothetical protein